MVDLTEKVEALKRRLNKLSNVFDYIRKSLTTKKPKQRYLSRTKTLGGRPEQVEEIVQYFNEILVELKNVKETLNIYLFTNSSNSTNTKATLEAELQYNPL